MARKRGDLPPGVMLRVEYAKHRNVAPSTVTRWISNGELSAPALRSDGTIDVQRADAQLGGPPSAGLLPTPSAPSSPEPEQLNDKKRRERADADLAEMKALEKAGELTDARSAELEYEDQAKRLRDTVLAVAREVAGDCARLGEPVAIEARIAMALGKALDGFSKSLAADDGEPAEGMARAA